MTYYYPKSTLWMIIFISMFVGKSLILVQGSAVDKQETKRSKVNVLNGCASRVWKNPSNLHNIPSYTIPKRTWLQTPSIVEISAGYYRALGRVIHMNYLQEQLVQQKRLNFDLTRTSMEDLVQQLEILADTIYVKDTVVLRGIRNVKINAREIVGSQGSKIVVSAPNWTQTFRSVAAGGHGEDGKHGVSGPEVHIFCDVIRGSLDISSNAGNGHKGQDGGNGAVGSPGQPQRDRWSGDCTGQTRSCKCNNVPGLHGGKGGRGGRGGNAGRPGNGGNAGRVNIRFRELNGQVKLKSCGGTGAQPARNGQGGAGGAGGRGGLGRRCYRKVIDWDDKRSCVDRGTGDQALDNALETRNCDFLRSKRAICPDYPDATVFCKDGGAGSRAASGIRGDNGASGSTPNSRGQDGAVSGSLIQSGTLDAVGKRTFPKELLVIMRRQAEDLLLENSNNKKGKDALKFVLSLTDGRGDVDQIKKYVERKLGFLEKDGYDIFGKNKLFAPLIKWETLEGIVENVKDAAEKYENAFNDIISNVENKGNFKEMASKMSAVSTLKVKAEIKRLERAKTNAEREKTMCVKSIRYQEETMTNMLENLYKKLPNVYHNGKFNGVDLMAVLQATVGFAKVMKSKDPLDFIGTALGLATSMAGKKCLKSLQSYLDSMETWLTFGKKYTPLVDSSALDFSQIDVSSVPQIMKANLEMNKKTFATELMCLLDVASTPLSVAAFKAEVESFFIAGAARIDLIAKVMDLDTDIAGYMFDIPLLRDTEKAIAYVSKSTGALISKTVQQNFVDYLLSTYRELERSFMRNLYELHKAFVFRTLWEGNNPLASFRRLASEGARGTGRLNGAVQLTEVLQKMKELKYQAVTCFTQNSYTTAIQKWSFDKNKDKAMFEELRKGYTRFTINIDCAKCYNVRLLKIYIELFGTSQPKNVPDEIHLQLRHLGHSEFRAGDNTIKQYRQPVGAYKNIKFDRTTLTADVKCQKRKRKGKNTKGLNFCMTKDDSRWENMCINQLNSRGSCRTDSLLGMEECKSPFGTYELNIPVDKELSCGDKGMTTKNCKDLDLTKFTKMNVWTYLFYWSDQYPSGPDDPLCPSPSIKRNNTMSTPPEHFPTTPGDGEDQ